MAKYHATSKRVARNEDGLEAEHLCDRIVYSEPWQRKLYAYLQHVKEGCPASAKARQVLSLAVAESINHRRSATECW